MTVYYFQEDIRNVTELYYTIIIKALNRSHAHCIPLNKCSFRSALSIPRSDFVLVTTLPSFLILYLTGHRNFIYWYQGVAPEENYQILKSKWRYHIYSYLEKKSLKIVKYKIGISSFLFDHFESKYKCSLNRKYVFVMPCFNSELNESSFNSPTKYEHNVFCYAGGIQAWQGFDEILRIYEQIESQGGDVFLKIYSKDLSLAESIINNTGIKNYSLECVSQDKIDFALSDCKFGFIIRDNTVINNVATPTKMGTYLANGVIPIFSSSIWSYNCLSKKYGYLCCVEGCNVMDKIKELMDKKIEKDQILKEYKRLFFEYYNKQKYIEELSIFFLN